MMKTNLTIAISDCKRSCSEGSLGAMPHRNEWAIALQRLLLSLDWVARHVYWRRLCAWCEPSSARRKNLAKLKTMLSSADLLEGEFDGVTVGPRVVIALTGPPPKAKGLQYKITHFFPKTTRKPKYHQLKITDFFKVKH